MGDSSSDRGHRHRLRQRDLVMSICSLFSEEYEKSSEESIWEVRIPIDRIKEYLQERHHSEYKSSLWVYTQLKRYEDELGVKLFRKEQSDSDDRSFSLRIYHPFLNFFQKQHLHVSEKIKVANGAYEKIRHDAQLRSTKEPLRLLLGAGSTVYHLAAIIADNSWTDPTRYVIYTHNLGALQQLLNPRVNFENLQVYTPGGRIDPTTYTIVGFAEPLFETSTFDFIVQGTSRVCDGRLYIESGEELPRKRTILHDCRGRKILVLTKHEFADEPFPGVDAYGSLTDYDFIIVPKRNSHTLPKKSYETLFDRYASLLEPEIISWNYEILKVKHRAD